MTEMNLTSFKYLSGTFIGLSAEKKDCVLNTARSLLKVQDDSNYPVNHKVVSNGKKENCTLSVISPAYTGEIKRNSIKER